MRLHGLVIENFRGVERYELELPERGVTIIEAPNESGKSSLWEAFRMLLKYKDSSSHRHVLAVRPSHTQAPSAVTAEFSVGNRRLVYRKQWHQSRSTTLRVTGHGSPEELAGEEAHNRVEELLESDLDLALWEALQVEQLKGVENKSLLELEEVAEDGAAAAAAETRAQLDGQVAAHVEMLTKQRAAATDEALDAAVATAAEAVTAAAAMHEGLVAELDAAGADTVEELLTAARAAQRSRTERLTRLRTELHQLEGAIAHLAGQGLYDKHSDAQARFEEAERHLVRVRRRADAAKLLHARLLAADGAARQTYVAPFRDRIVEYGRPVFGPDFDVVLDAGLTVESISRGGITDRFDDLSGGTKEQVGLIAMLACASLVAADGGVPVVIDDALGFSDADRRARMGLVLARAAEDVQVLVTTCEYERYAGVGTANVIRLSRPERRPLVEPVSGGTVD